MINALVISLQKMTRGTRFSFYTRTVTLRLNWFTALLVGLNKDKRNVYILYPAGYNR